MDRMTGSEATFGQSTDKGVRLAIDEQNAKGGVKGKHIRLVVEDEQGKQDETAAVVRKLITQDHIVALVGRSREQSVLDRRTDRATGARFR